MRYLHISVRREQDSLRDHGPVIQGLIQPKIFTVGREAPGVSVMAMLDTGATTTLISPQVVVQLGLRVRPNAGIVRGVHGATSVGLCEVRLTLEFRDEAHAIVPVTKLLEVGVMAEDIGVGVFVGRDYMADMKLICDFAAGEFHLDRGGQTDPVH